LNPTTFIQMVYCKSTNIRLLFTLLILLLGQAYLISWMTKVFVLISFGRWATILKKFVKMVIIYFSNGNECTTSLSVKHGERGKKEKNLKKSQFYL